MKNSQLVSSFIVWKKYQRRPEVFSPLIQAELKFFPHWFRTKSLRPLDYCIKLAANIHYILKNKPDLIIAQAPPLFSAIPPWLMKVPYIIDAHNPVFQGMWGKLPLSRYLIDQARAVIVHNQEILQVAKKKYPSTLFFPISDPIEFIPSLPEHRRDKQILVICSFDPWDEPVDICIDSIKELADYTFIITADPKKLTPELRRRLQECNNVRLTGFLPTKDYHDLLCSSLAALVLTTSEATQPSGACEALSSDTQLIVSKTSLTEKLFGEWAILVDNSIESIVQAIKSLKPHNLTLDSYRNQWNDSVQQELQKLRDYIEVNI
ncbi:MAG: glycosyltransferase family 4 protein [Symploca sp. SIO1A3]|nr:glycosyltransferase family 4 protein [Symploca sp. SIO1A3]